MSDPATNFICRNDESGRSGNEHCGQHDHNKPEGVRPASAFIWFYTHDIAKVGIALPCCGPPFLSNFLGAIVPRWAQHFDDMIVPRPKAL